MTLMKPKRLWTISNAVFFVFFSSLLVFPQPQDQIRSSFIKAKTLIEANCADCPGRSQSALEEGINLATKAKDAGYGDRAAVLRLLVDGYATLGAVFLKLNTPAGEAAFNRSRDLLKELMEAVPNDANVRYEYVHSHVGNTESMIADIDERIEQFRQVLAINPQHENARFDLAQDLFRKGEDDEAIALLRGLLQSIDSERAQIYAQRLDNFMDIRSKSTQIVSPITFSGEVSRGKDFEREFGPGLMFRLRAIGDPVTPGWDIEIVPKDSPGSVEYSWVLTPPYHGFNQRYLSVSYGFSAEQILEMNPRGFRFVRSQSDHDRARADVETMLGSAPVPQGKTWQEAFDAASQDMEHIPYCTGSVRILDSRLTEAPGSDTKVIDWLKFHVELCTSNRW
jgi:tetratricopeptide (TPR) repeat protein